MMDDETEDLPLVGSLSFAEAAALDVALLAFGEDMAHAIDHQLLAPGSDHPTARIQRTVRVKGKQRKVVLTFEMTDTE